MIIGIIGCGNMGGAMASHLIGLGQKLLCYDPDQKTLERMVEIGTEAAASARDVAAQCDTIILSLPKAAIVRALMADITDHMRPGAIILDTSTSEPDTSKQLAADATTKGYSFVDAPVSGGPIAAGSGTMTMLVGGAAEAIEKIRPILEMLAAKIVVVGPSGAGHAAKIANNMLCAANLVLVSEVVRLGEAAGVPAEALLQGVNAGSGRSGVSEVNFPKWILNDAFDSGFTMGLMRKDVRLALALAEQSGVPLKAFTAIADIWAASADRIPDAADFNEISKYHD